jgi:7tm Chemosensory receptor
MKNIFSQEMSSFVNIFQVLSLFPCSSNPFANIMLKFYSSLSLLMVVAVFCSAFFIFPVLQDTESLSLLVGGLVFIGLLITQFINLLQAFFSRQEQMTIYQKMDEIDDLLLQNQLLVNINYGRLRRKLYIKYSIIMSIILAIHFASIASVVINGILYRYHLHLILPILTSLTMAYFFKTGCVSFQAHNRTEVKTLKKKLKACSVPLEENRGT